MAGRLQFPTELLASTVQSDIQIVQRQAERRRRFLWGCAVEVNTLEQLAILFCQIWQKPLHALAQHSFGGGIGLFRKFGLEFFERTVADIASPIQIDDGM